jgi:hypothetical protein
MFLESLLQRTSAELELGGVGGSWTNNVLFFLHISKTIAVLEEKYQNCSW